MNLLTGTNTKLISLGVLFLRIAVGVILFMGGAGKALEWFGGFGMEKTLQFYAMTGISKPLTYLSVYTEFIGGFLLMIGLLTRPVAVAIFINMLVATAIMWPKGFLAGGASYPFSMAVSAIVILLTGPMLFSLDAIFFRQRAKPTVNY
jgi:putative oxidoreductase